MKEKVKLTVEIENIDKAQAIALEDMFRTWVALGSMGGSRWTAFFADGDGNFRPKIKVNGQDAQYAPDDVIDDNFRKNYIWDGDEYRIDFDSLYDKLRKKDEGTKI